MQRTMQRTPAPPVAALNTLPWLLIGVQIGLILVMVVALVTGLGVIMYYQTGRVMPGVSALGVDVGRLSVDEAAAHLRDAWQGQSVLTARDAERVWEITPATLGLGLDAAQTAVRAAQVGRGDDGIGGALYAILNGRQVPPALTVDVGRARLGLEALAQQVDMPAKDANIRFNGTEFQVVSPRPGRVMDIERMLSMLVIDPGAVLADGELELMMVDTHPAVTDVSEALAMAQQVLGRGISLSAYDPIKDELYDWSVDAQTLAFMLEATQDERRRTVLSLREEGVAEYLQGLVAANLGDGRTVDAETGLQALRRALADGTFSATLRITHPDQQYTVQRGETFMSIARKFGVLPYMIFRANPDVDPQALSVGQTITIPSPDPLIPLPPVMHKRIVVDMSALRVYVYENGQLIQDWPTSTGIDSSPTAPGVFQIQGRYEMAFASSWGLYMPHFLDVYEVVPGFFNGFHGLPNTVSGRQAVWGGALGNYNTSYGCIILGLQEAEWLYNWAEDGVIVEIRA